MTPKIFWEHHTQLLTASRSDLPVLTASLVSEHRTISGRDHSLTQPTEIGKINGRILLCSVSDLPKAGSLLPSPGFLIPGKADENLAYLVVTNVKRETDFEPVPQEEQIGVQAVPSPILEIQTPEGKKGQIHFLQSVLPQAMNYIRGHLEIGTRVCIACDTGKDTSVGIALAALQKFFDNSGNVVEEKERSAPRT